MKAYLKSSDGLLALQPKITTIGRHEDSDIVLKSAGVEDHHAALEFSHAEKGFVLRDFNSAHGTFVNGCHVQNAAVKVGRGDVLRFGFGGTAFELVLENDPQVSRPPTSLRTAWPGPPQAASETKSPPLAAATAAARPGPQFPCLPSPQSPPAARSWAQGVGGASPHPPRRRKPLNAWGRPVSSPAFSPDPFGRTPTAVAGNGAATGPLTCFPQEGSLLKERDKVIVKLGSEVSRLSGVESECHRKDAVIADLQKEIAVLTEKLAAALLPKESTFHRKLEGLDQAVAAKAEEVKALKEEIGHLQKNTSEVLYHSLSERDLQIAHWKQENEELNKSYSLTLGLVTSLQKDITSKEQRVQQLKMEAETLRRENREKDSRLAQVSAQCSRIKEETKRELRDREVNPCKNQIADLELKVKRSEEDIKTFRAEQERLARRLLEKTQAEGDLKEECEQRSQQLQEMGRRERLIKSDLELAAMQALGFRNQIVEVLFSQPPERPLADQEILEKLKEMQTEEEDFCQKEMALKEEIQAKGSKMEEISENTELLKKSLDRFQEFLAATDCSSSSLKKEISALQNLCLTPPASEIQASAAALLRSLLGWVDAVEGLLQDMGLDASGPEKGMASYMTKILDKHRRSTSQIQALQDQRQALEESQDQFLQERLKELKEKLEQEFQDKEKELQEAEEERRKILEGTSALQEAKFKEAMDEERGKVKDLEAQVKQLAQVIEQKAKSEGLLNAKMAEHLERLAAAERRKTLAEEKSKAWEKRLEGLEKEAGIQKRAHQEEISEYKEQVRQHARTIVGLESKVTESVQQAKKVMDENAQLQLQVEEMQRQSCQSLPAGSHVPSFTEGSDMLLKEELKAAKEKIRSDEVMIAELKTELSGARARVSDIIGELNERQKMELEQKRQLVRSQAQELSGLRQSLLETARRLEEKDADLQTASEALRSSQEKLREMMMEARGTAEEPGKDRRNKSVQTAGPEEGPATGKGLSTDLADLGAKCKGCRHEETIRRQKDALAELRQRMKALEKGRPSDFERRGAEPLVVLKKGPGEKSIKKAENVQGTTLVTAADAKKLPRGAASTDPNAMMERTARLDMADALDLSEQLYLSLVRDLAGLVDAKVLGDQRTVKHLPQDEREKVGQLRQRDAQRLFGELCKMKHRLERKESLLKEYERDLGKLRGSKQTLQACQSELAHLAEKVYRESEEKALLKEALERTRGQLAQEKRLRTALQHRKNTEEKKNEVASCYPCTQKVREKKAASLKQQPPGSQANAERPREERPSMQLLHAGRPWRS